MLKSQSLQVRSSEIKSKLNELANADNITAEQSAEVDRLRNELTSVEAQYRAAVATEDTANADADAPEKRATEELRKRASIGAFVDARMRGRLVDGAEEEYRAAVEATPGSIPLGMFEPREPRTRAVSGAPTTGTPASVTPIVPYVFASSLAGPLGIEVRTAVPGNFNVPRITTAPAAGANPVAAGAATDETAAVMDIVSSTPRRLPAAVRTNLEGIWTLGPEYEDALRESVRMQLSVALDNQLINGASAAPAMNGLITQIGLPSSARSAIVDWGSAVGDFIDVIDGLWAGELSEVFAVVNPAGYQFVSKLYREVEVTGSSGGGTPGDVSAAEHVNARSAGLRAHTRMPAEYTSGTLDNHVAVLFARRGMEDVTRVILPTWGELAIDDPYTDASKGERVYTFVMGVGNLVLVHSAAYAVNAWKLS